jgi:hypothetical protein
MLVGISWCIYVAAQRCSSTVQLAVQRRSWALLGHWMHAVSVGLYWNVRVRERVRSRVETGRLLSTSESKGVTGARDL